MDKYVIDGGRRLFGAVALQSAKNSVLPLLAASILTEKRVVIRDTPQISDVLCMAQILRELGADVRFSGGNTIIESADATSHEISSVLTGELRRRDLRARRLYFLRMRKAQGSGDPARFPERRRNGEHHACGGQGGGKNGACGRGEGTGDR